MLYNNLFRGINSVEHIDVSLQIMCILSFFLSFFFNFEIASLSEQVYLYVCFACLLFFHTIHSFFYNCLSIRNAINPFSYPFESRKSRRRKIKLKTNEIKGFWVVERNLSIAVCWNENHFGELMCWFGSYLGRTRFHTANINVYVWVRLDPFRFHFMLDWFVDVLGRFTYLWMPLVYARGCVCARTLLLLCDVWFSINLFYSI